MRLNCGKVAKDKDREAIPIHHDHECEHKIGESLVRIGLKPLGVIVRDKRQMGGEFSVLKGGTGNSRLDCGKFVPGCGGGRIGRCKIASSFWISKQRPEMKQSRMEWFANPMTRLQRRSNSC
ncbi:hypothetical protein L195_g034036 [Trifolium pratense]|uniref:Uncharacterized protein n=1 Tax=Trifolium pratense TaxID=57577 RepID=A0A2K3LHQ6_TRIPR|nr:hypothetical protein L195_g034036 [Trifolium pratense]